ncbi:DHH phosphoesterase [Tothia fuscella]|uniref:DHH phosphoesterase n=1 Tax=Tothia fuscella TaxID=1048955 RepID=A0A9P4U4A9_9PEZI|nr:DHH phosphoesterase [Tothia fuscella]
MTTFLADARTHLQNAIRNGDKVTIVMGNESADLDSLTSALLFAYVRTYTPRPNSFSPFYVPVLNIPASDIAIRPEFLALLPYANIDSESLITLNDLPNLDDLEAKLPPQNTRWITVDHNALQGKLGKLYASRVVGTIDHHEDEHKVPSETGDEPRIITKSVSCTSLVTNYCQETWDKLSNPETEIKDERGVDVKPFWLRWDAMIAQFALASILIDTNNLTSKDKTTDHDTKAVEYLESKIEATMAVSALYNRQEFFNHITEAKHDLDSLQLRDILRKDYKEWIEGGLKLGVSSVVKPIDYLVKKAGEEEHQSENAESEAFLDTAKQYAEDRGLNLFAIMTTSSSEEGQFQRQLLVWALNPDAVAAVKRFERKSSEELGLKPWSGSGPSIDDESKSEYRKLWQQQQVQHSRKRVAPLIREAMT